MVATRGDGEGFTCMNTGDFVRIQSKRKLRKENFTENLHYQKWKNILQNFIKWYIIARTLLQKRSTILKGEKFSHEKSN